MPISERRLNAIRKRAAAATDGPWKTGDTFLTGSLGSSTAVLSGKLPPLQLDPYRNGRHDAAFIAHSRQDIPALLAEIDRLRAEVDRAQGAVDNVRALLPYLGGHGPMVRKALDGDHPIAATRPYVAEGGANRD